MKLAAFVLIMASVVATAQQINQPATDITSSWFDSRSIDFAALTSGPPLPGSHVDRQDMEAVLIAQRDRTPAQIRAAQADDTEEDIFIFAKVLGPGFNAAALPQTAALSQHLREASAVVNPSLKLRFGRPRPFVASAQVHPACVVTATNSFPSGHGMVGTLQALALTQIVPERSQEILLRLDQYLANRVLCGVHYPSDVAASRSVALALFGLISGSPAFQNELASARSEVRLHLGLEPRADALVGQNYLANNTVLIVRHAEKPAEGTGEPGLTVSGEHRATAYVRYFQPFKIAGRSVRVTALYAGADSASSIRPRLTLEPLSRASGLPLDATVSTKEPQALLEILRTRPHGDAPLICWRHGQIPALLNVFGVAPDDLLPGGKWPDDVYDWVLVLQLDAKGRVRAKKLEREQLSLH